MVVDAQNYAQDVQKRDTTLAVAHAEVVRVTSSAIVGQQVRAVRGRGGAMRGKKWEEGDRCEGECARGLRAGERER